MAVVTMPHHFFLPVCLLFLIYRGVIYFDVLSYIVCLLDLPVCLFSLWKCSYCSTVSHFCSVISIILNFPLLFQRYQVHHRVCDSVMSSSSLFLTRRFMVSIFSSGFCFQKTSTYFTLSSSNAYKYD